MLVPDLVGRKEVNTDVCALPLLRRIAALLDCDLPVNPDELMPRGWHMALFTPTAKQNALGPDGLPSHDTLLPLPDPSLPRKMLGGRRTYYRGDLRIGSNVRRESEIVSVTTKNGRSGRLLVVTVRHTIYQEGLSTPAIVEEQDSIFRSAATNVARPTNAASERPQLPTPLFQESVTFDTAMLFRYSAITFNAHRIHFDYPYATKKEGYDGVLVNGGLPALFLLELARMRMDALPKATTARNLRPIGCEQPVSLCGAKKADGWILWVQDESGWPALEVTVN